jgi:hypothetical protein
MSHRISCYTLFDITQTGILNRARPNIEQDHTEWLYKRNTQCNFDTIVQTISLRSLPEILSFPSKKTELLKDTEFGSKYKKNKKPIQYWTFDFEIHDLSVFQDEHSDLGHLYRDINGVPMIICGTEISDLQAVLDISLDLKNIYFIKY